MTYSITEAAGPDNLKTWLDFVASLAWPTVVIVCLGMFRRQIAGRLDKLSGVSGAGVAATFEKEVEQLADKVEQAEEESPPVPTEAIVEPPHDDGEKLDDSTNKQLHDAARKALFNAANRRRNISEQADLRLSTTNMVRNSWQKIIDRIDVAAREYFKPSADWVVDLLTLEQRKVISPETAEMIMDAWATVAPVVDGHQQLPLKATVAFTTTARELVNRINVEAKLTNSQ